jgi:hypothetical protein
MRAWCAYEGAAEQEETTTNGDMEGMDGNIHDRFEKLEFDDANAGSPTNKDSSDDHQDGTKGANTGSACPLCATSGWIPRRRPGCQKAVWYVRSNIYPGDRPRTAPSYSESNK